VNTLLEYLRRSEQREDGFYKPTFFEVYTAIAFMHFVAEDVDLAVVEVGMGGRLDTTNVLRPLVCAITPVSMDHTQTLGNTLAAIAGEKAGIIKQGVPVVCGRQHPEALQVISRTCGERQAPLYRLHQDIRLTEHENGSTVTTWTGDVSGIRPRLAGRHQLENAATAAGILACLNEAGATKLFARQIVAGLSSAFCPARVEVVRQRPLTVIDSSHNPASIRAMLRTLKETFSYRRLILVLATARDKDVAAMLQLIKPEAARVVFTTMNSPRAVAPDELVATARSIGVDNCTSHAHLDDALAAAGQIASEDDLICICGSFYLAGDARKLLVNAKNTSTK
jgi:dihydrofolate synthase/folylpolyglutamate synthase